MPSEGIRGTYTQFVYSVEIKGWILINRKEK